jgi:hypothetical protein
MDLNTTVHRVSALLLVVLATASATANPIKFIEVGCPTLDETPIDASGAVGPDHLVSMTNHEVFVQDRNGAPLWRKSLEQFWEISLGQPLCSSPYDPRIVWNPHIDRFVAVALLGGDALGDPISELLVAVSETKAAAGTWRGYRYVLPADEWIDFPNLGFSKKWIAIQVAHGRRGTCSSNSVNLGSRIYVFESANLLNSTPQSHSFPLPIDHFGFEIPALNYDDEDALYFVQAREGRIPSGHPSAGKGRLHLSRLNQSGTDLESATALESAPWIDSPPDTHLLPQKGSSVLLESDGSYIQSVVQRNGTLWAVHSIYLSLGAGYRSSIQWWQIEVSSPTPRVTDVGRIDDPRPGTGRYYSHPSIAVNKNSEALIGFGEYASDIHASAGFAIRTPSNVAGKIKRLGPPFLEGKGIYDYGEDWSDYTSTAVDPLDDTTLWSLQVVAAQPTPARRVQLFWAKVVP